METTDAMTQPVFESPAVTLYQGDARALPLADESVDCVVTSPPYWGLRDYGLEPLVWGGNPECEHSFTGEAITEHREQGMHGKSRTTERFWGGDPSRKFNGDHQRHVSTFFCACGAWRGSLGLEPTPELYVEHLVAVFREVWRVLRPWGTVWLNMGDSYNAAGREGHGTRIGFKQQTNRASANGADWNRPDAPSLKPKDLLLMPSRVALALQQPHLLCKGCAHVAHQSKWGRFPNGRLICPKCEKSSGHEVETPGWWVRQDIIWSKPNPMPESVNDRPTTAHEHVFLLAKSERYYYDAEAVREIRQGNTHSRGVKRDPPIDHAGIGHDSWVRYMTADDSLQGRNRRSVWVIPTQPMGMEMREACGIIYTQAQHGRLPQVEYVEVDEETGEEKIKTAKRCRCHEYLAWMSHFATFPEALVEPCILAGTSERGNCSSCGRSWERVVEKDRSFESGSGRSGNMPVGKNGANLQGGGETLDIRRGPVVPTSTTGWRPTCACNAPTEPATVLDPFVGSGTVAVVAQKLGRRAVGVDLSAKYLALAQKRLEGVPLPMELGV